MRKHPSGTIPGIHEKIDDELRTRQGSYEKGFQSLTQDWKPKIITRCGAYRARAKIISPVWVSIQPDWRRCSFFPYRRVCAVLTPCQTGVSAPKQGKLFLHEPLGFRTFRQQVKRFSFFADMFLCIFSRHKVLNAHITAINDKHMTFGIDDQAVGKIKLAF